MPTIQQVAEAFSSHQFRDVYDFLHPQVEWTLVGAARLEGKEQVVYACEQSLVTLDRTTTQFLRFKTIPAADSVAIDTVAKYVDAKWQRSFVRSCDIYEFTEAT
ncbi:hypothetical protein GCM10009789_41350 [Kribbella sancticallisti]|uniref:SnoaL-like domain-containing protein n=1 Tax=Kribbella sancticallisti TaxID=460087 RepID=A0ABN2DTE5_9ACTN